jgi:hypothetical protein
MRTLQVFSLLLFAVVAVAQTTAPQTPAQAAPPGTITIQRHDFAADLQNGDELNGHRIRVSPMPWTPSYAFNPDANTCYFIRSYIMKREGEAGATHLDHVTTCTPKSRIRMKTKVKFTPAIEK